MFEKAVAAVVCLAFLTTTYQPVLAQEFSINQLPVPGTMVGTTLPFAPLAIKGLVVNPQKPLEFQFIVDTGNGSRNTTAVKEEANRLIKYFLAGLTIPEKDLWVNLSPYEKDRIVPEALGQTELGRDLLAQDYILKQLTASLIYPEKQLGREFWARVYKQAQDQFGTTNIPVNTFNKVWILPDQAQVFENVNAVYVTKSTLKVMLDEDYLALHKHSTGKVIPAHPAVGGTASRAGIHTLGSQIVRQLVRQLVLPEIEKEVNTGKNFAPLRQIYQALILAKWYKETVKNALFEAVYTNKDKTGGISLDDLTLKQQIYDRYLQAYKKGVFNFIKDESSSGQVIPRKYFSGGITQLASEHIERTGTQADIKSNEAMISIQVNLVSQRIRELKVNFIKSGDINKIKFGIIIAIGGYVLDKEALAQPSRDQLKGYEDAFIYGIPSAVFSVVAVLLIGWGIGSLLNNIRLNSAHKKNPFIYQKLQDSLPEEIGGSKFMGLFKKAIKYYEEGYDFKVSYEVSYTETVGQSSKSGNYDNYDHLEEPKPETRTEIVNLRVERGDKLSDSAMRSELPSLATLESVEMAKEMKPDPAMLEVTSPYVSIGTLAISILAMIQIMRRFTIDGNASRAFSRFERTRKKGIKFLIKHRAMGRLSQMPDSMNEQTREEFFKDLGDFGFQVVPIKGSNFVVDSIQSDANGGSYYENGHEEEGAFKYEVYNSQKEHVLDLYYLTTPHDFRPSQDEAMVINKNMPSNGGIDLNQININREGKKVVVRFDPAQFSELMRGGFNGFAPVIINVTPVQNPLPLLGVVVTRKEEESLARI